MLYQALESADAPARTGGVSARLLIVDDDPSVRATLAAVLRGQGYDVWTAGRVDDALARLAEMAFDLVLTDLYLDDADGLDLLAALRRHAPGARIVVMTSYATLESALSALQAGAYAYVVKPTDVDELCVTVARGLEHRQLERDLAARVAELEAANTAISDFNARLRTQVSGATDALRHQVAALDTSNQQLRETQEQHERFVAMVAHELKSPLGLVMSYAQLSARPGATPAQIQRYTGEIIEAAQRLNRLVEDLRTATRLSTGHFDLRLAPCDLAGALRSTIEGLRTTVAHRRFSFEAQPDPGLVMVDSDRVLQAVRNLLDNAVKYSAEDGAIAVRLWSDAGEVCISVCDQGAGIPEDDIARLLLPFERGPGSTQVPGSGLGLYITRGIATAHGGELRVRNGDGPARARGAVFTLVLRRVAARGSIAADAVTAVNPDAGKAGADLSAE
jgi:signal transduction histidine kinase